MEMLIWTEDEDTGDLVPVKFDNVKEVTILRKNTVHMQARADTINITEPEE